jgi:hypothetical protein
MAGSFFWPLTGASVYLMLPFVWQRQPLVGGLVDVNYPDRRIDSA